MGVPVWNLEALDGGADRFFVSGPVAADALRKRFGDRFADDQPAVIHSSGGTSTHLWANICERGIMAGERLELPGIPMAAGPLLKVMERLLGDEGCPWDRRQTPLSLLRYLLDESYEAAEALVSGDLDGLTDELGDVLLQVVFQSALLPNRSFDDVALLQAKKLIRRHPHVFRSTDAPATSYSDVVENWEANKLREGARAHRGDWVYPALVQARRATKRGIEPESPVFRALRAQVEVYCHQDLEKIEEILGDAAWAVAAAGQTHHADAEWALWKRLAGLEDNSPEEE